MPYGVKHGIKTPGQFGMGDILGLGLAGAAGIVAALVTDFQAQGEASALYTINKWVVEIGGVLGFTDIPLWMVVLGMTAIGAGSIFYFQPITRQGAFAQGFGLLAVLMTATPPNLAGGLSSFPDTLAPLESLEPAEVSREAALGARLINANFSADNARLYQVQNRSEAAKYDLYLKIVFPDGIPNDVADMIRRGTIRGRLHNEELGSTWNLFRSAGGTLRREGNSLVIHAGVPARSDSARLWVRVEAAGYTIEEQSAVATLSRPLEWTVEMQSSNVPLPIQRLSKSYWF
ncbi:MAG: hypothetical protein AAF936_01900 [Pseudomonadota bacterium]